MKSLSLLGKNKYVMGASQIREELHQFINRADERMLNLLYDMMKSDAGMLTPEQEAELERRIARHKSGESNSYSWAEVRAKIEKRA